jgi:hypothetical protein
MQMVSVKCNVADSHGKTETPETLPGTSPRAPELWFMNQLGDGLLFCI